MKSGQEKDGKIELALRLYPDRDGQKIRLYQELPKLLAIIQGCWFDPLAKEIHFSADCVRLDIQLKSGELASPKLISNLKLTRRPDYREHFAFWKIYEEAAFDLSLAIVGSRQVDCALTDFCLEAVIAASKWEDSVAGFSCSDCSVKGLYRAERAIVGSNWQASIEAFMQGG